MSDPATVLQAALQLDANDREKVLEALAASLYGTDLGAEWEGEIQRRVTDIDAGRVKLVPGDEVLVGLVRKLGG